MDLAQHIVPAAAALAEKHYILICIEGFGKMRASPRE
jgi:hypothetical protein